MAQLGIVAASFLQERLALVSGQIQRVAGRSEEPVAAAFRGDGPEAEDERGETDDDKAPDQEHVPIRMIEFVQERGAVACSLG